MYPLWSLDYFCGVSLKVMCLRTTEDATVASAKHYSCHQWHPKANLEHLLGNLCWLELALKPVEDNFKTFVI